MRISSVAKKAMAVTLSMAVAMSAVAAIPAKDASAAKKSSSKKVVARVYYAGTTKDADCVWVKGDGTTAPKLQKTLTLKKGKKTKVSFTIKKPASHKVGSKTVKISKMTGAAVLTVDLVNVLKSFKSVKFSGATVKADGKKVKIKKVYQGAFEKNKADAKYNYRLSFFNKWGNNGDNSKANSATAFAFKKNLTVSFTVTAK